MNKEKGEKKDTWLSLFFKLDEQRDLQRSDI